MEGNPGEHIEAAEMARLLENSRQRMDSVSGSADLHPHLTACSTCRQQFEDLELLDRRIENTRPIEPVTSQHDCPPLTIWREVAGGLIGPEETLSFVAHASRCGRCGPSLRQAIVDFRNLSADLSDAERQNIASLESASAEWQKRLADQITASRSSGDDRGRASWWQRWIVFPRPPVRLAVAGVSLLAVVGAASWALVQGNFRRSQPPAAERLLARAYTEKRTLELRIQGADYAPLRVSLGPAASFVSRPAALLKAEALIATQIESHRTDPSWLRAQAEADVLEGKYDAAVEALRHALELQPRAPDVLTDLATAYFQRAQSEDRKEDLGSAYECLSQSLELRPDDPIALFNRAIVAEQQFLYHQALDDWERYLRVEPVSQWAEEARNRASAVREKLKEHGSKAAPLLSPTQIVAVLGDVGLRSEIDQRIDEYLHEAVRSWLPQAFAEGQGRIATAKAHPNTDASLALFFLADVASQQHRDRWLSDLLAGSSSLQFPQAAMTLARAVQANDAGEYGVSRQQAELAEHLFRASGNTAGTLRAEFEQSFEAQISRRSEECRRRAISAGAESKRYPYPWVQIQLGLEESVCSMLMGDIGAYEQVAGRAQDHAQQAGYGALYLRALGFVAESKFDSGDPSAGWRLICDGLDRYWSGQFPAMRGYNLYSSLANAAEVVGQSNLQLANWLEAEALIDDDEDLLIRAWAHNSIAKAANAAHRPEVAERQYREAAQLYALAPRTEATQSGRIENEIKTAQLEARQSAFDAALARLTRVQGEVGQLSNNYLAQIFYSTLGEVQLRSHHAGEAELAFRPALRLAEKNLASLTSETERMSWSKDAAPVYLGLAEAELMQGREQESLDVFEWYLGAHQRAGLRGHATSQTIPGLSQSPPDPSRLLTRFPLLSNQTVLAYGVLPDGLAIWVYDNRGVNAKWIPKAPKELQDLAANFFAECSDPSSELSALRRDSQTLYSQLIAPVESRLDPIRTLVIETEGFLARFPFEALMDASGHYLIERGSIVHSPGLYAEARMHSETAISPDSPALVIGSAVASPDTGLFDIPNIPAGADTVARIFHSPHVLEGPEATLGAVTSALPAAAVFHFAGHAISTSNSTGLMLEGGSPRTGAPVLLDTNVVRKLRLRIMQLAVLAACSTDSGEAGFRGLDSVAEALQTSGVPHVVASRWVVDSVEARSFVDDFYRAVLSGQPVSNATRLTSVKMLFNPRTVHPFYWAAFAAYGRS